MLSPHCSPQKIPENTTTQRHIMAYVTTKAAQDLAKSLLGVDRSLDLMDSFEPSRFMIGMDIMIATACFLPLVRNADNTLSILRQPLVPLLKRHIMPFSAVVLVVAQEGQFGLISRFRPWAQYPDVCT